MNFLKQRLSLHRDKNIAEAEPASVRTPENPSYGTGDRMELLSRDEIRCLEQWLADETELAGSTSRS